MKKETALTWSWLNCLTKRRYETLKEVYGNLDHALEHLNEDLLKSLGCRDETLFKILNRYEEFDVKAYQTELDRRGLRLISTEDETYPSSLKEIGDPPIFLVYKGDLEILHQPCIGLVGTREVSPYGKRVVEEFVPALVQAKMITVSGLAQGIDTVVAQETLRAGGRTVAVLGHGLSMILPQSNGALAKEIIETGGLIMSEFPIDTPPDKHTFPARNRIIAGLTLGTVVFEAPESSGALITAELALEYGREVFAVPGQIFDPNFAGCHKIIGRGHAKLVTTPKDVLEEIGIVLSECEEQSLYTPKNPDEERLLSTLTTMPQTMSTIIDRSGIDAGKINTSLTMMELAGAVKNVGNGEWVRT